MTPLRDETLGDYLRALGLVGAWQDVEVTPAGDGNINWVRRARVAGGASWIVKQARPALERFPQYRASTERIVFEARYYEVVRAVDHEGVCPRIVQFDEAERTLVLEDLGSVERLDHALARGADVADVLRRLARFLAAVHSSTRAKDLASSFANEDMRRLHGEHIFRLPFHDNDFPLGPAVRGRSLRVLADAELVRIAERAHERYLEPYGALVHADVQAGNVLLAEGGAKLLDAEIAHVGDPAFDVGTLLAHVFLSAVARRDAVPASDAAALVWREYARGDANDSRPSFAEAARYAGIEMMRRTIGAARVAAVEEPATALAVIDAASVLMREPPSQPQGVRPIVEGALG